MGLSGLTSLLCCLVLGSVCLLGEANEYGVSYYSPPQPAYAPSYAPQPYYEKPAYYETYDTKVDYREANATRRCGILPAVHRNEYGYERDRLAFGEYPWTVGVLDSYQTYLCAGGIISPRHVITSAKCVKGKDEYDLRVRIGEYDLQSDHNYLEAYKNYEIGVCKKHQYYNVPKQYASTYGQAYESSYEQYNYDVVILELSEDIDFDVYPQAEPVCLPEYYERSKNYYAEKTYSYTTDYYGKQQKSEVQASAHQQEQRVQEGVNADLECWVAGYNGSPLEKISYQQEKQEQAGYGGYGYSYKPTYYDYYEQSRTPRKAKVHKVYEYESYYPAQSSYGYEKPSYGGYSKPYKTESWEAEYYYDTCKADQGAAVFCLVPGKYEQEKEYYYTPTYEPEYKPAYQPEYKPSYQPEYKPSYQPEYKPAYQPEYKPAYQPEYKPAYQPEYKPSYSPKYKRGADYYKPAYQPEYKPAYQPEYKPAYQPEYKPAYQPEYKPAYQPEYKPAYQPAYEPVYQEYKYPIAAAEYEVEDYRRAVLVGIVSQSCDSGYGAGYGEIKKITVTPVKDIVDWILNVIHGSNSCAAPSYSYESYTPEYVAPSYTPAYAPAYTPEYTAPSYTPAYTPAPSYAPAPVYTPSYTPEYTAPAYTPAYAPAPAYTPAYAPTPSYAPAPAYTPPSYSPY